MHSHIFRVILTNTVAFFIFQVCLEFNMIVGKNLKQEFYASLDQHSPRLIDIFRSKRGNVGQLLTKLSQQIGVGPYS